MHASHSSDNQWNDWSSEPPQLQAQTIDHHDIDVQCELLTDDDQSHMRSSPSVEKPEATVTGRLFGFLKNVASPWSEQGASTNDWNDQSSPLQFPSEEPTLGQTPLSAMPTENLSAAVQARLQQIVSEHPELFPRSTGDTLEDLNQLIRLINKYQEPGSSELEAYQKQIDELQEQLDEREVTYQRERERLIEERNQAREQLSQTYVQLRYGEDSSSSHVESQTDLDEER